MSGPLKKSARVENINRVKRSAGREMTALLEIPLLIIVLANTLRKMMRVSRRENTRLARNLANRSK